MEDGNWFKEWWESVEETWRELGKRWEAFIYRGDYISPTGRWKFWQTNVTANTCLYCLGQWGKVYGSSERPEGDLPVHPNCRCEILPLPAMRAGTATIWGLYGADWWIKQHGILPDYYVTKEEAQDAGWKNWKGNLADAVPGKSIGGNVYKNKEGKLPNAPGRIWYEADINYTSGYRGDCRILYSNDGLIFVTYNHYLTFIEIV